MKKLLILLIPFFIFIFGSNSYAYSSELANEVNEKFFEYGVLGYPEGQTIRSDVLDGIMSYWEQNPDKNLLIFAYSNYAQGSIYIGDNLYVEAGVVFGGNGKRWTSSQWNSNGWSFNTVNESTGNFGGSVYNNSYYDFGTYSENNIDYSNIIYDPFIPTPDYSVTYTEDSTTIPRFPLEISLKNADSNYYVEVIMENMTPSFVGVKPDGTYEAFLYYQFASNFVYPMSAMTNSTDLTTQLLSGSLSSAWRSDILSYDPTSTDSFYVPVSDSPSFGNSFAYSYLCAKYNQLRQIACFYGNNTGISIRYFRVENGQVYAGKIRSWTNLYGGVFSEELPSYYRPYEEAQGYEKDLTEIVPVETSTPNNVAPNNQYGTKTGLNININVGSNVPNYPDYPTIATYNTDNLLVNAIDTASQLPDFFTSSIAIFNGMFEELLPEPFWGIIMTGFLFSIVIMIIKVL